MPVYEQVRVPFEGNQISAVGSLMTDSTTYIKAHHNYGYAI
jgi:hypothetical protein